MRSAATNLADSIKPILVILTLLMLTGVFLLDRALPQAGAWVLVGLTLTAGFVHGALDAALLQRRFNDQLQLLAVLSSYLLTVVLLGWALSNMINAALWLLILMSVWHFGEPYGRWSDLHPWASNLTRVVVGGAPIMIPVWLAPDTFAQAIAPVVDTLAVNVWQRMAEVWLVLAVAWVLACGLLRAYAARHAWAELLGCIAVYALFSPLMAFALYFGAYHSWVHIWRVWRGWSSSEPGLAPRPAVVMAGLAATTVASWLLGAALWWLLSPNWSTPPEPGAALQWVIVALAAVTAPHLLLISASTAFFSVHNDRT